MMTTDDITEVLKMLSANYGKSFYDGTNLKDVIKLWSVQFANDDPKKVMKAVQNCIATLTYKPTIADIRKRMAGDEMKGQLTSVEAFQEIAKAVSRGYDRDSAIVAFNDLSPILRRVVGTPNQLVSWRKVSEESFQTVIMSAIRESYRELAQREADYYALPKPLKIAEGWRVEGPEPEVLPEPEKKKTIDELHSEMDEDAKEYREKHGMQAKDKYNARVDDFKRPMTDEEMKAIEKKLKGERDDKDKGV